MLARLVADNSVWRALARRSTLDPEVKANLVQRGRAVTFFKLGTRTAATKGSWRAAVLSSTKLERTGKWTLWTSVKAAASAPLRADLKRRLCGICLTADGVMPLELSRPSAREAALGPAAKAYLHRLSQEQRSHGGSLRLKRRAHTG